MEPNEQSSPPEDFYQQQLQFADRVFFGATSSNTAIITNSGGQTDVFVDSFRVPTPNPIIYGTGGQYLTSNGDQMLWTNLGPIKYDIEYEEMPSVKEDSIPPNSMFARIKIQKEKRKRKK